jgi:hypothetical protein
MTPFLMVENWLTQTIEKRISNLVLIGSMETKGDTQNQESVKKLKGGNRPAAVIRVLGFTFS